MKEIIVGLHSIVETLLNPARSGHKLYLTKESKKEISKKIDIREVEHLVLSPHELQDTAKRSFQALDFRFSRVPSNMFLETDKQDLKNLTFLYNLIDETESFKMIILDQITDVHNLGAIMRSASFYGAHAVLISRKGDLLRTPTFYRIASGSFESVPLVNCGSLPKTMAKLKQKNVSLLGFSEHSTVETRSAEGKMALVLGAEDLGLSNAIERLLDEKLVLKSRGKIKSLNVSVAAAIAMERLF